MKFARGFLNSQSCSGARLWFGPKGTVTPLHHDGCNILFGQVYGRKQFKLIPSFDIENVYNEREWYSAVDLLNIDYIKFPRMSRVSILEAIIEPGEFIFIPIGWWHWVRSLDISISVSFTNFCVQGKPAVWRPAG